MKCFNWDAFKIASVNIDHSSKFRRGILNFDKNIAIVDCYAHMFRNVAQYKFQNAGSKEAILQDIKAMRASKSRLMFNQMTTLAKLKWRAE